MIFLRHPVTDAPDGLCYGRLELGHGAAAETQMRHLLEALPQSTFVVSSPARRCRIVAERIAARDGLTVRYDARLLEFDFGVWEGRMWVDLPRRETDAWTSDLMDYRPRGGEVFRDMIGRVDASLGSIVTDALVVCHAGVIRAARMIAEGLSLDAVVQEPVPYCEAISLDLKGRSCAG